MDKIKTTEGDLVIRDARFAIVAARFNGFIVESLLKAAVHCLRQHGAADADMEIIRVPGSFEMPVAVEKVAALRRFDGLSAEPPANCRRY
jgi:6,7-dimethyl-8-ribityllumazine synthase